MVDFCSSVTYYERYDDIVDNSTQDGITSTALGDDCSKMSNGMLCGQIFKCCVVILTIQRILLYCIGSQRMMTLISSMPYSVVSNKLLILTIITIIIIV